MKNQYVAPETWSVPLQMESVLCQSMPTSNGEMMNPWEGDSFETFNIL